MIKYLALRLCVLLFGRLPTFIGSRLAGLAGETSLALARESRRNLRENLRHVLGDAPDPKTLDRLTREAFRNLAHNYYDLFRLPHVKPEKVANHVEIVGMHHLTGALELGRGAVIATAHMGNFDLVAQVSLAKSIPMTVLVERFEPERLWRYWMELRASQGMSFYPVGRPGVKAAFQALKRGEVVGLACDRLVHGNGIETTFMGAPATMPVGAAEVSLRTGAALVPAFCVRVGRDCYRITIEPPLLAGQGPHRPTDDEVRRVTEQVIALMERHIRAAPSQWMVLRPLWRAAPAGDRVGGAGGRPVAGSTGGRPVTREPTGDTRGDSRGE